MVSRNSGSDLVKTFGISSSPEGPVSPVNESSATLSTEAFRFAIGGCLLNITTKVD